MNEETCRTNEAYDTYRTNEATVMASFNGKSEKQPFSTPVENDEEWLEPRIQPRIHNGHITMSVD